ncbi:6,7-dimethyl-8-ribityllumazine synthase [Halalkalibaculum sp. DA3122]|uniref:6,7-dimethyl-8-ribityllumazine synthase n=1 Tax=unclassified Halalkalibaculum TaxID=2964617 RepID=UPI003754BDF9
MPVQQIEADITDSTWKIGIVAAQWNSFVTDKMLAGALDLLRSKGLAEDQLVVARCPGSFEIPLTVKKMLTKVDGVIAIGAVIRGDTPHFDYVCEAVTRGLADLNLSSGKPVGFGILTTDTVEQATKRADAESPKGNKGTEAALAVLEMLSITQQIESL